MEFAKMAIVAIPTKQPAALTRQNSDLIAVFGPILEYAFHFQQVVSTVSLAVFAHAWFISVHLLFAAKVAAFYSFVAAKFTCVKTLVASAKATHMVWNSKNIKTLRRKLVYEFFVLFLGPAGNSICTLMFWPGWWALGLFTLTAWVYAG